MDEGLFGVPWAVLGGIALVVALIFAIFWPSGKVTAATPAIRYFILRWFHALVWILLALLAFLQAFSRTPQPQLTNYLSLGALCLYLIFTVTLVTSK